GLVAPPVRVLYDYAWFVGFAVAFVVYGVLMRGTPPVDLSAVPEVERPTGGETRAVAGDRLAEGAAQ
ncbi:MAG TPA: hypothetical protein VF902_07260, partial [Coriobacteriia bacterium]